MVKKAPKKEVIEYDYDEESALRDEYLGIQEVLTRHAAIAEQNGTASKSEMLLAMVKTLHALERQLEKGNRFDYLMTRAERTA